MRIELNRPEALMHLRVTQPGREGWLEENGERVWGECSHIGSISIPSFMFLQCPLKKMRKIWLTLFDYIEDDEYDGDLQEHDDENPRIQMQFKLTNEATSVSERKTKETYETTSHHSSIQNSSSSLKQPTAVGERTKHNF